MSNQEIQAKVRIAVDLGASSGRVMAAIPSGGKLTLTEIHRFENPAIELPTGLYWNILGLFHEILTGLKKAIETHGENIASIGIDTWGCDFGLFDHSGELIGPPHQYRDPRFEGMAEKMHNLMSEDDISAAPGSRRTSTTAPSTCSRSSSAKANRSRRRATSFLSPTSSPTGSPA